MSNAFDVIIAGGGVMGCATATYLLRAEPALKVAVIERDPTYAVFEPEPTFPVSGTLRAALAAFTKLYADQYAAKGIRMNNVLPGFIDSLGETPERRQRIPMGRYGTVAEIAKTVRFLLSSDAGYITGQNLRVDGGITRSV